MDDRLADLERVFGSRDPLLGSPSQALLAYLLIAGRPIDGTAAAAGLRAALERFATAYAEALDHPGGAFDRSLLEFSEWAQQGTNDHRGLERRLELLTGSSTGPRRRPLPTPVRSAPDVGRDQVPAVSGTRWPLAPNEAALASGSMALAAVASSAGVQWEAVAGGA